MASRLEHRAFFGVLASALAVACSAPDSTSGESREAIVHGAPSTSTQDFVVLIYDANAGFECTGALIAPSLVLTARHCVSRVTSGDSLACDRDGHAVRGGEVGDDYPPGDLAVYVGTSRDRTFPWPAARGANILHDGAKNLCNHDLALLEIAPRIATATPPKLALDAAPTLRDTITVVGWGATDGQSITRARLQRSGVQLLAVGPASYDGLGVPSNAFVLGESICDGDSGAPAIAEATGAIVGVASFGSNGVESTASDPAASCVDKGKGVLNTFTSLAAFKPLVARALADSGAPHSN